jgi:hypothetical protein
LDLESLAAVEVTSEDPEHPIECALVDCKSPGWVAVEPGPQLIRLVFDEPQHITRIHLVFIEKAVERTQESVLRSSSATGAAPREILRQQWSFSPSGSTQEVEDYRVDLAGLKVLELTVNPNTSGGNDRASLSVLRVA